MHSSLGPDAAQDAADFDVAIIGAGIAGINTAYHLKTQAPKPTTYTIFEAREAIGGTWDLFRYPGIRSDSDIFTFGFSWYPWKKERTLASGSEILDYMAEATSTHAIDTHIRFQHKVMSANWSSKQGLWNLVVRTKSDDTTVYRAKFIVLGTGYYNYEEPLPAYIPGINNFGGAVVRPQFWPKDLDYADKNVVIIGSGATAITLLPSMAEQAKHVVMLQRSPTYIVPLQRASSVIKIIRATFPLKIANALNRFYFMFVSYIIFYYCVIFPERAKRKLEIITSEALPATVSYDPHFRPRYNPWSQRMCVCPDGDFFNALKSGKASVVTDTIESIDKEAINLTSGANLRPDIIVAATGLQLRFAGGIKLSMDDTPIEPSQKFMWKGCMLQDVPNLIFQMGYVNASYSLAAEVTGWIMVSVLHQLRRKRASAVTPRMFEPSDMNWKPPKFRFTSTYLRNADKVFPRIGKRQWSIRWFYLLDMWKARWGDTSTDLEFS